MVTTKSTTSTRSKKPTTRTKKATTKATISPSVIAHKVTNEMEQKNSIFQTVVIALLLVITGLGVFGLMGRSGGVSNVEKDVTTALEKMEAMKVGGTENFELLKTIMQNDKQKAQYKQQFETMLSQLDGAPAPTPTVDQPAAPAPTANTTINTITADQIAAVTAGYTSGNPDAKIAIVEYSDIQCPFCKRHHNNGTTKQAMDAFPGQVKYIFKHYPLGFHQDAPKGAEALECFGEQLGADKFYEYIKAVYAKGYTSKTDLTTLAAEMGTNVATFKKCLDSNKYAQKVKDQMAEGARIFKVSGTPGNVILNTENGKRELISGAYPVSKFKEVIKKLLAE